LGNRSNYSRNEHRYALLMGGDQGSVEHSRDANTYASGSHGDTPEHVSSPVEVANILRQSAEQVQAAEDASQGLKEVAAQVVARESNDASDGAESEEDYETSPGTDEQEPAQPQEVPHPRSPAEKTLQQAVKEMESDLAEAEGPLGDERSSPLQNNGKDKQEERDSASEEEQEEESEEEQESEEEAEDTLDLPDKRSCTLLFRHAFHGNAKKAKELLNGCAKEQGVDSLSVNPRDKHGWTPLIWASSRGHIDMCELLIRRGALLNVKEETNGWTALHLAAINGHLDIALLLLESGASKRRVDRWGDTAHECAPRPMKGPQGDQARELRKLLRPTYK